MFQQIVGQQDRGGVLQQLLWDGFAPDPLLQRVEAHGLGAVPSNDFTVNHGAIRQEIKAAGHFRKAVGDQFLTARPQVMLASAQNQLPADAVPFPFCLPVFRLAEFFRSGFQLIGQIKRVGARQVGGWVVV